MALIHNGIFGEEIIYTLRESDAMEIVRLLEFFGLIPSDESEDIIATIKDYYMLRVSAGNIRGFGRIQNIINFVKWNGYANSCIKICGLSYNEGGDETCSICLDKIVQLQQIPSISCMHKFHDKCLSQWLDISKMIRAHVVDRTCLIILKLRLSLYVMHILYIYK